MGRGAGPNPEIRGAWSDSSLPSSAGGPGPTWVDGVHSLGDMGEATAECREGVRGWAEPRSLPSFRLRKA